MKVLFLKDVGGVGQRDEIKEVADGYAMNSLIPRGFAVQATPEKVAAHQKRTYEREQLSSEHRAQVRETLKKLNGKHITIQVKANEKGHLYKGISKEDVAANLMDAAFSISPDMIDGAFSVIREVGEHVIHLADGGAEAIVTLVVEAANALP